MPAVFNIPEVAERLHQLEAGDEVKLAVARAIDHLLPYVDAFRREEARADRAGQENDRLRAALKPFVDADWYADGHGRFEGKVSKDALDNAKDAMGNQ